MFLNRNITTSNIVARAGTGMDFKYPGAEVCLTRYYLTNTYPLIATHQKPPLRKSFGQKMTPNINRKNVKESLDLWAEAEKNQRTLSFDDYGDVDLVYTSEAKIGPELRLELQRQAVLNVIAKIHTELREFAAATKEESGEHVLMQLPSLGKFAASGKIGNLRNEWQTLQVHQTKILAKIATERQNIFNEFKGLLPQMPTHFENDGTAILRNDFTSTEHENLIKQEIKDVNKYKLNANGYYQIFMNDLPRTRWSIEIDGVTQSFGLGLEKEKLDAIKKVFGNDQSALSTVSKLMNQAAPGLVIGPNNNIYPRNNRIFINQDRNYGEPTFLRISSRDNCINFEASTYSKSIAVVFNADDNNKGEKNWHVNQDERWKGSPGPNNYGQHYRLAIQIDKQAASNGLLKPVDGTKIEASFEIRLCPAIKNKSV
jgi:hypothetical protein